MSETNEVSNNGTAGSSATKESMESTKAKIETLKGEIAGKPTESSPSEEEPMGKSIDVAPKVFAGMAEAFTKVLMVINKIVGKFLDKKINYLEKRNDNGSNDAEILETRAKKAQIDSLGSFLESQKGFWDNESKTDYPPGTEGDRASLYGSIADLQRAYRHALNRGDNDSASAIYSKLEQAQKELDQLGNKQNPTSDVKDPINAKANQESLKASTKGKMHTSQAGKDFWAKEKEFWDKITANGYPEDIESFDIASTDLIDLENQADKLLHIGSPAAMAGYSAIKAEIEKKQSQLLEMSQDGKGSSGKTTADDEERYSDYKGDFYTENIAELEAALSDSNISQEDKAAIQDKINTLKQAEEFWHGEEEFWYVADQKGEPSDPEQYDEMITNIIGIQSQIDLLYQQGNPDAGKIEELTKQLTKSKTDLMGLFSA